jgi:uncharacterized protein (DUF2252 family)
VQLGGDAHLSNLGAYASPERQLVFDQNDFDETLPGPWEWDLKRLATSFVVAGQFHGHPSAAARAVAAEVVRSYRESMARFAREGHLALWYDYVDADDISANSGMSAKELRKRLDRFRTRATRRTSQQALEKLAETVDDSRRALLGCYELVDAGVKVVGVGSVGTRCLIALLIGRDEHDPLFLQIKEADSSVLAEHLAPSRYAHQGQRVVEGQRLVQATSDIFLGWTTGDLAGVHF